jgi:hypothetical protein
MEAVETWLSYKALNEGRSPATVVKYLRYLQQLTRCLEGQDPLTATAKDLERFTGLYMHK